MMAATPEEKFRAAVRVIRGLPKNGMAAKFNIGSIFRIETTDSRKYFF